MSILDRFLGTQRSKAYAEGIALLEEGHYAEAVSRLRVAVEGRADSTSGSLASFHFRQALVAEGRHLLRNQRAQDAVLYLGEAVSLWDRYPDLHCLHGVALGFAGAWDKALESARTALRLNPDYIEARLLETVALNEDGRGTESADSLNALLESGRRIDHWLIDSLAKDGQYSASDLPQTMSELLLQAMSGRSEKEDVAAAVSLCRSGKWEEGLAGFAALVQKRPNYPDYRTRYAAALFQLGRNTDALAEVEAALALNDTYRTAADLKGLIMADSGRLLEARTYLQEADKQLADGRPASAHEELFGTYLRAVLALLTGRPESIQGMLVGWPDLGRNFARAELLLAAADYLCDRPGSCGQRLAELVEEWPADADYFHLLACFHLQQQHLKDVTTVLGNWPAAKSSTPDHRALFLEGCLAVCQGRVPAVRDDVAAAAEADENTPEFSPEAWAFLSARAAFLQGKDSECWKICQDLTDRGFGSERVLRLQIAALASGAEGVDATWQPEGILPDSCLPVTHYLHLSRLETDRANDLVENHRAVHPDSLIGHWLSARFWLDPIRNWIA